MIRQAERMIPCRGRDDAEFFLFRRKWQEGIPRAAFLETAGALEVFQFAKNVHARSLGQRNGKRARGLHDVAGNSLGRILMSSKVTDMLY